MFGDFLIVVVVVLPAVIGIGLLIRSATILVGQIRRKELLSLTHVHIVCFAAILFDVYVCFNNVRLAMLSQRGEASVWITNLVTSFALVVLPYGSLILYRRYQRQRPDIFLPPRVVRVLADHHGIRDALLVTVCMVAVSLIPLFAPHISREALLHAAQTHHTRMAETLLGLGADPNVMAMGGWTPLTYACRNNDMPMIRLLLENGADVNYGSPITTLQMASRHPDLRAFNLLLDKGVNVNANYMALTALSAVAREGTPAAVRVLLERGADVNAKTFMNQTALMEACKAGNAGAAQVLLEYGADVNVKAETGETALIGACWWKPNSTIVKALLERGADVAARQPHDGKTPLMMAAERGATEIVALLLTAGSDVHATDKQNNTPMSLAERGRHARVVDLLKEHGAK